jgi:hypothetical protein
MTRKLSKRTSSVNEGNVIQPNSLPTAPASTSVVNETEEADSEAMHINKTTEKSTTPAIKRVVVRRLIQTDSEPHENSEDQSPTEGEKTTSITNKVYSSMNQLYQAQFSTVRRASASSETSVVYVNAMYFTTDFNDSFFRLGM